MHFKLLSALVASCVCKNNVDLLTSSYLEMTSGVWINFGDADVDASDSQRMREICLVGQKVV